MHVPNIESSINHLKTILEKHQNLLFSNDVERYLSELRLLKKNYQINIEAAQQEGRNLKIAVVGQMKAGKSSETAIDLWSEATKSFTETKVSSSVAMPRISSTSCMSGTGFIK